jgi:hypothetical protein
MSGRPRALAKGLGLGSSFAPAFSRVLQRKCACGQHSMGVECDECKKKHSTLRRQASGTATQAVAPPVVHEVLRSPGRPLEVSTRTHMEARLARHVIGTTPSRDHTHSPALLVGPADSPAEHEADSMADAALADSGPADFSVGHDFSHVRVHTDR